MHAEINILTEETEFREASRCWCDLLQRCVDPNTFLSHEWLYSWWMAYKPSAALRILCAARDGRFLGVAPLMIERRSWFGVPVRVLRFIGDGTWETDHMSFLVDRSEETTTRNLLYEAIFELEWDVAIFNQMPQGRSNTIILTELAKKRSWRTVITETPCPRTNLPGSYKDLLFSFSPRFRTSLRSSRRKLQENYIVEFGLHERFDELPDALNALFENHASRWRAKGEHGVFLDPRKRDFYARLTPELLARGWLRFFYMKLDGKIVAQQYCFQYDEVVMLLQEGFNYEYAKFNLGNTLRGLVFEYLMDKGIHVYDFLAGTSRHKEVWSNGSLNDLRIECSRGVRGTLYSCLSGVVSAAKNKILNYRRDQESW